MNAAALAQQERGKEGAASPRAEAREEQGKMEVGQGLGSEVCPERPGEHTRGQEGQQEASKAALGQPV